jgi:hypothetical protein
MRSSKRTRSVLPSSVTPRSGSSIDSVTSMDPEIYRQHVLERISSDISG